MFKCKPTDPQIQDMDDVTRAWMFCSWSEDMSERNVLLRNQSCLIGSFWNPQMAKEMMGEGITKITTTDEESDKAWDYVLKQREEEQKNPQQKKTKRRKKKLAPSNQR